MAEAQGDGAAVLSTEEALGYWDSRHAAETDLKSGGDVGLSEAANEAFYQARLGRLIDILLAKNLPSRPLRVLDAGCGKGWFSRALARCGCDVLGVDPSPAAIAECRRLGGGPSYAVTTLSGLVSPKTFDAVVCVDVLFHIVDDDEWRASVRSLCENVRLGGLLVIADVNWPERRTLGNYIVHRSPGEYAEVIDSAFTPEGFVPYGFGHNPIGFHTYRRSE